MKSVRMAIAASALVALTACAGSTSGSGTPDPVPSGPSPTPVAAECASIYADSFVSRLPSGTTLSSVTVCHGGQPAAVATSTDGMETLAAGLTANDAVLDPTTICTKELRVAADFVVETSGGQKIAAIIPTDECGKPRLDVVTFLENVK